MSKCIISFLLLFSLLSCIKDDAEEVGTFELKVGDTLPAFTISNQEENLSATDLQNKVALVIFFNTTCTDCQRALPEMDALYNSYHSNPSVRVLLIARGQSEKEVGDYLSTTNCLFNYFTDPARKVYSLFAEATIPRLFLAGKDGKIVLTQTEYIDKEKVAATIELLLNAK